MRYLYNILIYLASGFIRILSVFNKKMKSFIQNRKNTFQILEEKLPASDKVIWFHCASLGEFEQGVPIIEGVRRDFPEHKILISFFSPSGFEIRKNTPLADAVVYLPLDTASNAKKFIEKAHPDMVFFVKYEFWPNFLFELKKKDIPTYLISGLFRESQIFFKSHGRFMRKALMAFDHFFVQNNESKTLLEQIGFKNVDISGDTRFDRVFNQLEMDNRLDFAEEFKNDQTCIVFGSTWPEDEDLFLDFLNSSSNDLKFIIAPHKIEKEKIEKLKSKIQKKTLLHSELEKVDLSEYQVLIIDCIGILGKLYSYADISFVGGAAGKTGLHNILEPATFGVPIVIGKNHENFPEAEELQQKGGLFSVKTPEECTAILQRLTRNVSFRIKSGEHSEQFILENKGATSLILDFLRSRF